MISQATIRSAVGLGARVMIEEALRRAGAAEDIDEMLAEVLVHYEANIAAESRPFPGAVASLEMLAKAGQGSRCARTSANISRASCSRRLAFNITFTALRPQHVRRVEAGPGHVTHVIAFAGGEPSHTIMVGGSDVDIGTAKRAHVPSILVSFGYAPEALHELAPDATIDHFDQLVPKATSLLGASPAERQHR